MKNFFLTRDHLVLCRSTCRLIRGADGFIPPRLRKSAHPQTLSETLLEYTALSHKNKAKVPIIGCILDSTYYPLDPSLEKNVIEWIKKGVEFTVGRESSKKTIPYQQPAELSLWEYLDFADDRKKILNRKRTHQYAFERNMLSEKPKLRRTA